MKLKFLFFPAILICLLSFAVTAQEKRKPRPVEARTYEKWVERDALYIITPEEKKTFLALKTNVEREEFIELFWLRRDPNPDTEINEYREAYYDRIAYTNEHFSSAATAGWRTDKGRIYIIYGKPDSVITRFDEKEAKAWIEEWHYRSPDDDAVGEELKFVFVDIKSDGNFRLKNDAQLNFR